jgi:hypothetical protein
VHVEIAASQCLVAAVLKIAGERRLDNVFHTVVDVRL